MSKLLKLFVWLILDIWRRIFQSEIQNQTPL
jgi:hypothetical protein